MWGWTGKANAGVHRTPFEAGTQPPLLSRAARARDQIAGASAVRSVRHSLRLFAESFTSFWLFPPVANNFLCQNPTLPKRLGDGVSARGCHHAMVFVLYVLTIVPFPVGLTGRASEPADPGGACHQAELFTGAFCPREWSKREMERGGRLSWWIDELWVFVFLKSLLEPMLCPRVTFDSTE